MMKLNQERDHQKLPHKKVIKRSKLAVTMKYLMNKGNRNESSLEFWLKIHMSETYNNYVEKVRAKQNDHHQMLTIN